MEKITIYKFQLKQIKEALRLTSNIHESRKGETCFDRQVRMAEQFTINALNGEFEKEVNYMQSIPVDVEFNSLQLNVILTALENELERYADTSGRFKKYPTKGTALIIVNLKKLVLNKLEEKLHTRSTGITSTVERKL